MLASHDHKKSVHVGVDEYLDEARTQNAPVFVTAVVYVPVGISYVKAIENHAEDVLCVWERDPALPTPTTVCVRPTEEEFV